MGDALGEELKQRYFAAGAEEMRGSVIDAVHTLIDTGKLTVSQHKFLLELMGSIYSIPQPKLEW